MSNDKPIYVTRPALPDLAEFTPYLQQIWDSQILTNAGPMHERLETALCDYLNVPYLSLFNNATTALMASVKFLGLTGEVITTPFSFIATSHAILWNNLTPVFVDVDPQTFNIDPTKIEAAITPNTSAIMAVHCYGQPCDIAAIQAIADKHGLKVIYDAAHVFGNEHETHDLLASGDLSILSFHATKVFSTFEGGAIICKNADTKKRIDQFRNFGISSETTVDAVGLNGKMSEVHAAFGLLNLSHIDRYIDERRSVDQWYRKNLAEIKGIIPLEFQNLKRTNHSYFPVLIDDDYPVSRDDLYEELKKHNIFARRYFYPAISDFAPYKPFHANCPVSDRLSRQVLCLPIYAGMTDEEMQRVMDVIAKTCA